MDVKIKSDDCNFKMRVAGCLIKDDKLLTVKIGDNGFYCLPGGHVQLGESSNESIIREFREEVNVTCKNTKLISIIENFFFNKEKKKIHEICYFYLIEPEENIETKDYEYIENDAGELKKLSFKWVDLDDLRNANFRPVILKDKLEKRNYNFEHIIYDIETK